MPTDFPPPIDPHLREVFERLLPGPLAPGQTLQGDPDRVRAAWKAFEARVVGRPARSARRQGRTPIEVRKSRVWLVGAMACLAVALGIGTWIAWSSPSAVVSAQTFATQPGRQMTIRLSGGSTIRMAPATSVTVAGSSVAVRGAAYFTVAPRASRPLTVRTRTAVVQVLGTRFEVRQYADESTSRVVVEDGRVAVRTLSGDERRKSGGARAIASAGMMAQVSDSGVSLTSGVATRALTGWVRDSLVFDWVPLREVVAEVGRVYGADVQVADSALATARVNVELSVTRFSLVQVLSMLSEVVSAHYVVDRGAFVLVPGRRARIEGVEKNQNRRLPQPEKQYGR